MSATALAMCSALCAQRDQLLHKATPSSIPVSGWGGGGGGGVLFKMGAGGGIETGIYRYNLA